MRSYLPEFDVIAPKNLDDVLKLLTQQPEAWTILAGGTDLMVQFEAGTLSQGQFISIWGLDELKHIQVTEDCIDIGALVTFTKIQENPVVQAEFPCLCQAGSETGGVAIQNRGTLGGNIVNASPAADSPPALLVYDAKVELVSEKGSRWLLYSNFHRGYKEMAMEPDELLKTIRLPRPKTKVCQFYRKVGTRKAQAISKVVFAGLAEMQAGIVQKMRLSLGSVAPMPIRCQRTENLFLNKKLSRELVIKAREELSQEITPIADIRSTYDYRMNVAQNVLQQFLEELH